MEFIMKSQKYTKRQIQEAIKHWESVLKESSNDEPITGKQFCNMLKELLRNDYPVETV